jgi:hypothetical protein
MSSRPSGTDRTSADIVDQLLRQVLMHAAGAEIGGVQPRAAGALVEHHQLLALFEAPERRRQRAHVQRLRGDVEQVRQDAADLGVEHPDQLAARGTSTPAAFRRPARRRAPGSSAPRSRAGRNRARPAGRSWLLDQLLGAAVQQADMRIDALDDLAVELQHQAQHAVRRRVLRAEVDVEVADVLFGRWPGRASPISLRLFVAGKHVVGAFPRLPGRHEIELRNSCTSSPARRPRASSRRRSAPRWPVVGKSLRSGCPRNP